MKYLSIQSNITLQSLSKLVGSRNVDAILNANQLTRLPNVGEQLSNKIAQVIQVTPKIDWQRKSTLLNGLVDNSDIYEYAALMNENAWKVYSQLKTFPGMLLIPETVDLPTNINILGNGEHISTDIYNKVVISLESAKHIIEPSIFNEYSIDTPSASINVDGVTNPIEWFNLPWGKISLHSSIEDEIIDFPVYPEELSDTRTANYEEMPEMIYQYEPWQLYKSSGPRKVPYTFHIHRDMWTGNHMDGKCQDLIDFCNANCYPEYSGAAVHVPICTLYMNGKSHCRGVITEVSTKWSGPIGQDGWYLECTLELSITEVSSTPLNYNSVRRKVQSI